MNATPGNPMHGRDFFWPSVPEVIAKRARSLMKRRLEMTIERWNPFSEMVSLRDAVNSLVQESFVPPNGARPERGAATFTLPLDISEAQDDFVVMASMPGIKPEDVQTTILGDTLTIRGESKADAEQNGHNWLVRERRVGPFQRSVRLGTPINADKASAQFEHGVLTMTLPKSEQARPKQIKISVRPTVVDLGGPVVASNPPVSP
jgi:HSP20 family protein